MKFLEKIPDNGKQGPRYMFVLGKAEATILQSIVEKAIRYIPHTIRTESTEARLRNMSRALKAAIGRMRGDINDDTCPYIP